MSQQMPVIRLIYWPALIPQFIMLALLTALASLVFPSMQLWQAMFLAAAVYLVICRINRATFTRAHARGMRAYKEQNFEQAISHFQASRDFFCAHPRVDAARAWLFAVASRNPYRVIALANMAYCHGQSGNGSKAIELYEQVLKEAPDYLGAKASLQLLKAGSRASASPVSSPEQESLKQMGDAPRGGSSPDSPV